MAASVESHGERETLSVLTINFHLCITLTRTALLVSITSECQQSLCLVLRRPDGTSSQNTAENATIARFEGDPNIRSYITNCPSRSIMCIRKAEVSKTSTLGIGISEWQLGTLAFLKSAGTILTTQSHQMDEIALNSPCGSNLTSIVAAFGSSIPRMEATADRHNPDSLI